MVVGALAVVGAVMIGSTPHESDTTGNDQLHAEAERIAVPSGDWIGQLIDALVTAFLDSANALVHHHRRAAADHPTASTASDVATHRSR